MKETGNRTFRELLSDWVEHVELTWATDIEETATQLQQNSRKAKKNSTPRQLSKPVFPQLRFRVVS
jgi:hypothetical protein